MDETPQVPGWLAKVVADRPKRLGELNALIEARQQSPFADLPWLFYLDHLAATTGLNMDDVVNDICESNSSIQSACLSVFPKQDFSNHIPAPLCAKYHIVPFSYIQSVLSVAFLEPEQRSPFYQEFVGWAKENSKLCALQFFLVTPLAWKSYQERN